MQKRMIRAMVPALLVAGAALPLATATPASADPPCAEDVYGTHNSGSEYQITVTLNRCDRPTRAIMKCSYPFGSGVSRGDSVIRGTSRTLCSRNTIPVGAGWEVYYGGSWHQRWV